jgi:uncharacterized membrane protein YkvA (DUF1232 family)
VIGHAFSSVNLIPDFISVIECPNDLILVPIWVALSLKTIPPTLLAECREKARTDMTLRKLTSWVIGAVTLCIWVLFVLFVIVLIIEIISE